MLIPFLCDAPPPTQVRFELRSSYNVSVWRPAYAAATANRGGTLWTRFRGASASQCLDAALSSSRTEVCLVYRGG